MEFYLHCRRQNAAIALAARARRENSDCIAFGDSSSNSRYRSWSLARNNGTPTDSSSLLRRLCTTSWNFQSVCERLFRLEVFTRNHNERGRGGVSDEDGQQHQSSAGESSSEYLDKYYGSVPDDRKSRFPGNAGCGWKNGN